MKRLRWTDNDSEPHAILIAISSERIIAITSESLSPTVRNAYRHRPESAPLRIRFESRVRQPYWAYSISPVTGCVASQLRAERLLIAAKNSQRKRAFTAELERAEILIALPVRRFRFGSLPGIQFFEIAGADRAFPDSLD